jgi:hypothetical protein
MLTIRTSKCSTIVRTSSSALFLWLQNSKGGFVGNKEVILGPRTTSQLAPSPAKSVGMLDFGHFDLRATFS